MEAYANFAQARVLTYFLALFVESSIVGSHKKQVNQSDWFTFCLACCHCPL